jgi:hypothetical protein
MASEFIAVEPIMNRPASATITTAPENSTATPDVRMATRRLSSGSLPARTSAR